VASVRVGAAALTVEVVETGFVDAVRSSLATPFTRISYDFALDVNMRHTVLEVVGRERPSSP
ncbi:hypothetical protein BGZ65_008924, partial [Modicella reniformis]